MDTTILIKTKKDIKLQAQSLAHDLGLSLADVVNASLRQFVINQGITISKNYTLQDVALEAKIGKNTVGPFSNKKDLFKSLGL